MKIPVESALCLSARRFCHLVWKAGLPASSDLCHLAHVCHPKHWLKALVVGKAEDKSSLQVSEKSHEGETGYGCIANDTFGKCSEEQQLIKNVQRSFAVVRQGKQLWSCDWHRLVWHGTSTLLCLSQSLPPLSFFLVFSCRVWAHPSPRAPLHTFSNMLFGKLFSSFQSMVSLQLSPTEASCVKWVVFCLFLRFGWDVFPDFLSQPSDLCPYKIYCFLFSVFVGNYILPHAVCHIFL